MTSSIIYGTSSVLHREQKQWRDSHRIKQVPLRPSLEQAKGGITSD
jgi:hypothetical protein